MNRILFISFMIVILSASSAFSQPNEERCKKQVYATIDAIDMVEQQTGQEKSLNGLTKKEIENMLKTMTYCEVMREINKRTHK